MEENKKTTSIEELEQEKQELLEMKKYLKRTKYLNYSIPVAVMLMFNALFFAASIEKGDIEEKVIEHEENDIVEFAIFESYFALLGISAFQVANQENRTNTEAVENSIKLREKIIESKRKMKK